MRLTFFLILGIFLWAGTVSIKFPQQETTLTASAESTCSNQPHGNLLLEYLKKGTISSIHDNGHMLTIGLSPQWRSLPSTMQQHAYHTVICYAQSLQRPYQFQMPQQSEHL